MEAPEIQLDLTDPNPEILAQIMEEPEAEQPPANPLATLALPAGESDSEGSSDRKRWREPTQAKSGPPTIAEWQGFVSGLVFRLLTDGYINFAFRGIDEDVISDRDLAKLTLTEEERDRLAVPFAEFANKSKFLRKHGRMIMATADSAESGYILAGWMIRVNAVAARYRPQRQSRRRNKNVSSRPSQAAANAPSPTVNGNSANGAQYPAGPNGHYFADFPSTGSG